MSITTGILLFDQVRSSTSSVRGRSSRWPAQGGDSVVTIAERLDPVTCAKGLRVLPDHTFTDAPALDVVVVPGGQGTRTEIDNPVLLDWIAKVAPACTWVDERVHRRLPPAPRRARAGKQVTTHWASIDRLRDEGDVTVHAATPATSATATWSPRPGSRPASTWRSGSSARSTAIEHARFTQHAMEYQPEPPYAALV